MDVSIVGIMGLPARYGGFETLAENLVQYSNSMISYTVFCSGPDYEKHQSSYMNAKLRYLPIRANGVSSILYDMTCMLLSLNSDAMLVFGVSGALILPFLKLVYRGKIIINIDGLEWKRAKWGFFAKSILKISEAMALRMATTIVVDNMAIKQYVDSSSNCVSRLIEYGGDNACVVPLKQAEYPLPSFFCFSVCRIEPENNVDLILSCFEACAHIKLIFIGNWDSSNYGKMLKRKYQKCDNISLIDSIYDIRVLNYYRANASVYIHGHSAGGTNPSLVEAMSLGLPVFAYNVVFNRETTENGCWYFNSKEELISLLSDITEARLVACGQQMKRVAERRYTWSVIAEKYKRLLFEGQDQ